MSKAMLGQGENKKSKAKVVRKQHRGAKNKGKKKVVYDY